MSECHEKPWNSPDEQWSGEEPAYTGGEWDAGDEIRKGVKYVCWFGGGETIEIDGKEIVTQASIRTKDGMQIELFGYHVPWLTITNDSHTWKFDSDEDAPEEIGSRIQSCVRTDKEIFQSHFGKLFLERVPECLDYTFTLE